jgi:MFS family permease
MLNNALERHMRQSNDMRVFTIVWLGQMVSLIGSGLTSFALGLWVYQRTGSVTQFALIGLCATLPRIALAPLAGALADRWNRRALLILSDAGASLGTLALALLLLTGQLSIWQIYAATAFSAACGAFQSPAYAALVTLLVHPQHYGRANGMVQFGQAAADIVAPLLAGVLVATIEVWGVLLIDWVTFLFAVGALLLVRFPRTNDTAQQPDAGILLDSLYGWRYIAARPGLLGLLLFLAATNFLWGLVGALIAPMVLSFASAEALGVVISVAGAGLLAGSLAMSAWGGPQRRINGVLTFELLSGLCFLLMGMRPSAVLVAAGAFGAHATIAVIYGSNQAIWQAKVPLEVQGRVFAAQQMIVRSAAPLAYLSAGPLADRLFGPLLAPGGALVGSLGLIVGVGAGRGIGALFIMMGVLKLGVAAAGYLYPRIRHVEDELPDMIRA